MNREPPYDGNPCPMCPVDIRGLCATAHNMAWRLRDYARGTGISSCVVVGKFFDLKTALEKLQKEHTWPIELQNLYDVCQKVVSCKNLNELAELYEVLQKACDACEPLSQAHFRDRKHSHGE